MTNNFDLDDLRSAIKEVERIHGSDRAAGIIRGAMPDYAGDLTFIPKNLYPSIILDLQEAVAGRRYFGQPRHSTFQNAGRDGYSIPTHFQSTEPGGDNSGKLDTASIWEKFNSKKAKQASASVADDDDAEAADEKTSPAEIDANAIYAKWNRPRKAPAK